MQNATHFLLLRETFSRSTNNDDVSVAWEKREFSGKKYAGISILKYLTVVIAYFITNFYELSDGAVVVWTWDDKK